MNKNNPYESSEYATYIATRRLGFLGDSISNFNKHGKKEITPVILVSSEVGRLPKSMGEFANYISVKSGGLGEVVAGLYEGLHALGIHVYLIIPYLEKRLLAENKLDKAELLKKRHSLDHGRIRLVSSPVFSNSWSVYDGNSALNAAEFQKIVVNSELPQITSKYGGRGIICTHDWFASGLINAYCNLMGNPSVFVNHNFHSQDIPLSYLEGGGLGRLWDKLFISYEDPSVKKMKPAVTAIKNSSLNAHVGKRHLEQILEGQFEDKIDFWYRNETRNKQRERKNIVLPNGVPIDSTDYTGDIMTSLNEHKVDIIEQKKAELVKFQKITGLEINPNAILMIWGSRLDTFQKGIDLAEKIAGKFVYHNPDVQMAFIGDGVGGDKTHENILGRIACASNKKIVYYPFSYKNKQQNLTGEDLSILGYKACSDTWGCSLYEPFGLNDIAGNLNGATATNRDTGGYHDKIEALRLKSLGATRDHGNGFLFKDYDESGLWWGLQQSVNMHRYFRKNLAEWEKQARRIIKETREKHSLKKMVVNYVATFVSLNNEKPLIQLH